MARESSRVDLPGHGLLNRAASLSPAQFDAVVLALATWSLVGVLLDVRSHGAGASFALEGFLTVPHIIFYSGFAGIAVLLVVVVFANRRTGATRREAVPDGYQLGLLGAVIFGLGGPADALWHATFSTEAGIEALTSPTHLMLATGAVLFLSSPLRAAHGRTDDGWLGQATTAVSATYVLTSITIITLYSHPLVVQAATMRGVTTMTLGVVSVVFQAAVLLGIALVLIREFDVLPGTFTVMLTVNGVAMTWVGKSYVLLPAMVVTGLVADGLLVALDPAVERPLQFRMFAAGVPVVLYGLYFLTIELAGTIQWVVHVWVGAIVLAGFSGLLMSYVTLPSARTQASVERGAP